MIARRSLLIILNKALGTAIGFAGIFFIFRYMDKSAFGMYAFTFGLVGLFQLINGMGVNAAHVKRISAGHDEAEANGTFIAFRVVQLVAFLGVMGLAYWFLVLVLHDDFFQNTTPRVLLMMVLVYTIMSVRQIYDFSFRAHRHVAIGETVLFVDSLVTALGFFTVSQVWRASHGQWVPFPAWTSFWTDVFQIARPLTVEEGALLQTAAFFLGTLASSLVAAAFFIGHRYPIGRPTKATARMYLRFAWPVAIITIMTTLFTSLDTIFLGYFWEETDVADYRSTIKLLVPALVFGQAVWALLFPSISEHHAQAEMPAAARQVRLAERYLSMILVGVLMLPLVFATEALNIAASQAYLTAAPTLRWLTLYAYMASIFLPAQALLMGSDRPLSMARVGFLTTTTAVALNLWLVPRPQDVWGLPAAGLGAPGAAIGTGIALAVAYVFLKRQCRQQADVPWIPDGLWRQAAAGLLAGLAMWGVKTALGPAYFDRFFELGAAGVAGLLVYWIFLVLVREFGRAEWEFVKEAAHPAKMRDYFTSELKGRRQE